MQTPGRAQIDKTPRCLNGEQMKKTLCSYLSLQKPPTLTAQPGKGNCQGYL